MIKYGIKIWTNNSQKIFEQTLNLFAKRQIDFVELYIHPAVTDHQKLKIFKKKVITIHATKYEDDFDIFKLTEKKVRLFNEQVIGTADFLKANLIVVHAGAGSKQAIFKNNLERIFDPRIVIENMPRISLDNKYFFGYSLDQLKWIKEYCKVDICLDIGHAIKSAASERVNYKDFLSNLLSILKPTYFHLSGGFYNNKRDEHLNLYEGNIDWSWIKNELNKISINKDIWLVFETPKTENDLENINYFKKLA